MERPSILFVFGFCFLLIQEAKCTNDIQTGERCGKNWVYDSIGHGCYRLYSGYDDRVSWSTADERCRSENANLVSIATAEEQYTVTNVLQSVYVENVWLGASLNAEGDWEWSDGATFSYTYWNSGEPTSSEDEKCIGTVRDNSFNKWSDANCNELENFVCKKPAAGQALEPVVTATSKPSIETVSCTVNLQSWGNMDATSQRTAYIQVNGQTIFEARDSQNDIDIVMPGIYVTVLDLNSCATSNLRNFGAHYTQAEELANFLRSTVPDDGFVLWVSVGEFPYGVQSVLSQNGLDITELQYGGKFAAVTQKGHTEKTQTVVGDACNKGSNLQATIKVEGTTLNQEDATITMLSESGNIAGIDDTTSTSDISSVQRCGQDWFYYPIDQLCYRVYGDGTTWSKARERCESADANLVSILNNDERFAVANVITVYERRLDGFWIGASSLEEDGVWKWSDGSPFSYTSWYEGTPTNSAYKKCVKATWWQNFMWNDASCQEFTEVVCKKQASGPAIAPIAPATRKPCTETGVTRLMCVFESITEHSLYDHNDKILRDMSPSECKKACLNETDFDCLSFDYTLSSDSCYLSASNRETVNKGDFGAHSGSLYYEKSCTEVDSCYLEPVSCTIDFQSWGINDANSQKTGYIKVNGQTVFDAKWTPNNTDIILPGLYVVVLDLNSCSTLNLHNFGVDHYLISELDNYMKSSVPDDGFVLWISVGRLSHQQSYYEQLKKYGLQVVDMQYNSKYAAVTQKGYPNKTQTVVGFNCVRGNNLQTTIEIKGTVTNPEEATITILAETGNILSVE